MHEMDEIRDAAAFTEESIKRLQELSSEAPDMYSLDLTFSLSLASSCLTRTEQVSDALNYAKGAVEEQCDREDEADAQYDAHLRQLLRDIVLCLTEMGRQEEVQAWFEEMTSLGQPGELSEHSLLGQASAACSCSARVTTPPCQLHDRSLISSGLCIHQFLSVSPLAMPWSSPEPKFGPELLRTGPKVRSKWA